MKSIASFFLALLSIAVAASAAEPRLSILSNGHFSVDADDNGWPDDWPQPEGASLGQEPDGTRYIRLTGLGVDKMPTLYRLIPLKPSVKALQLKYRARAIDVVPGKEKWHDARIIMHFRDAHDKEIWPDPESQTFSGSTNGWYTGDIMFKVPDGAVALQFIPCMFNSKSGTFDLAAVELLPIPPKAIEMRRIGTPVNEPVPATVDLRAMPLPSPLKLAGNQLQDATGKAVWLQGIAVVGLETSPTSEGVLHSVKVAAGEWKANVIRLPVSDAFWSGKGAEKDAYRLRVDAAIRFAADQGAYTVLALNRDRAPDQSCVDFWMDVAKRYKNHPAVIFGLFDEPCDITWDIWRDGGEVAFTDKFGRKIAFRSVGMQRLADAVRQAGANNLLIVGGLDRAYDLTGIANGYALRDRAGGAGIMYDVHLDPTRKDWKKSFLDMADKYPIFVGRCGIDPRDDESAPKARELPYTWAPDTIATLQQYKLHWTASSFSPEDGPRLIDTWKYEPTPFWGAFVRVALSGGQYRPSRQP